MSVVNTETGELVEAGTSLAVIDKTAASVVTVLENAKTWLSTAVEMTGPEEIAAAKAHIRTAETYARELHLSKEIQQDAQEMVRRAEYALRKSTTKAQAEGDIRTRESSLVPGARTRGPVSPTTSDLPRPRDFFTTKDEYEDANAMGALEPDDFEAVLTEAKAEGNLSRANVAAKAREKTGPRARQAQRDDAETYLNLAQSYADKAAKQVEKLTDAQIERVKPNAALWVGGIGESVEALQRLLTSLTREK